MRLKDKIILVTGSTTGIGKAIASRVIREGGKVILHGLEEADGLAKAAEWGSDRACFFGGDLADPHTPALLIRESIQYFGQLHGLVNNAAWVPSSNIRTTDSSVLDKVLQINLVAPFALIRAALPYLTETKGVVLNIGSVNAYSGEPNLLAYSISKGGLMTMTRNLGDALPREYGVRVNQINPGWVLTENEIRRKKEHGLPLDWYTKLPSVYAPSGRILWPEEIAAAAVYWLADESGPISGQVVDLEQHPFIGRNPPKDSSTIPA
jgi:NAD(P)-dependent dehydrogenase (short-subunit alcohol dehydrogenase family)